MRKLNIVKYTVKAMKAFFQRWVVAILVMAAAIAGNIEAGISQDVKTGNLLLAQTQIKADDSRMERWFTEAMGVKLCGVGENVLQARQ